MSNTIRKVQPNWGPGYLDFDTWNDARPNAKQVKSVKHQTRDRKGNRYGVEARHGPFKHGYKNDRYALKRKIDELRDNENRMEN